MSGTGSVSGAPNLSVIDAITQFAGGTQSVWNSITVPIPSGLVVYAIDTTVVKMGDGVTLYAALPTLFTLNSITSLTQQVAAANSASSANAASITTINTTLTSIQQTLTALSAAVSGLSAPAAPTIISAGGTVTLQAAQQFVGVTNTTGNALIIELPAEPGVNETHTIKDMVGFAQSNPITLNGNGNLIDTKQTAIIDADFGAMTVRWNSQSWSNV